MSLLKRSVLFSLQITLIIVLICFVSIQNTYAQSPGAHTLNLNLWLKANSGTSSTVDGTTLSSWNDQSTSSNNATQGIGGDQPTFSNNAANNFNYNEVVTFNGSTHHFDLTSGAAPIINENYTVFIVAQTHQLGSTRSMYSLNHNFPHRSSRWRIESAGTLSDQWGGNIVVTPAVALNQNYILTSRYDNTSGREMFFNGTSINTNASTIHNALNSFGVYVGAISVSGSPIQFWDGDIAEIIHFREDLIPSERLKVHSYLAIKYGMTMSNTGGGINGDYTSTLGAIIWDASIASGYHNDVIGIGLDNNQGLHQKQSHSTDDLSRIYVNGIATTNSGNGGTMATDQSYVIIGNDQGTLCNTASSTVEVPSGLTNCTIYSRLEREWKIKKSSFSQSFNLDLSIAACAIQASVAPADLRLLVDDDGDFSNGGTTCFYNGDGTGVVLSYAPPYITVSNISNTQIGANTRAFITIASVNPITPLPVGLTKFSPKCIDGEVELKWETASEVNNAYFTIARSRDGNYFESIATVPGNGTVNEMSSYSWKDSEPAFGTSYYRLLQTDTDGTTKLLSERSINCEANENQLIHPNPFDNELTFNAQFDGDIILFDNTGNLILKQLIKAGENVIEVLGIASGSYIAYITYDNGQQDIQKLIKL